MEFTRPAEIERESMRIIDAELAGRGVVLPEETKAVVRRVIHTTADFDYAENLRFTKDAVPRALGALRGGATIVTDTNMALAGVSKPALRKLGGEAITRCFMVYDVNLSLTNGEPFNSSVMAAMHVYNQAFTYKNYGTGQAEALILFVVCAIVGIAQVYIGRKAEVSA